MKSADKPLPPSVQPQHVTEAPVVSSRITWSPWVAVLLVICSFLVATVLAQLLLSVYPYLKHWSTARADAWLNNSYGIQFAYTLLAYTLILLPILWFLRRKKVSLQTIGLKRPRLSDAGMGLAMFPLYFIALAVITAVVNVAIPEVNLNQQQQIGFTGVSGFGPLLLTFASLAVIPPIVEETVMRGFLFTSLRAKLKLPAAVLITSVLFAAGHLQFGSGAPLLWVAAIDTFTLSLFLIYLRVKTNSLWASIMLHALKNSLAFVYIFILHKS